MELLNRLAEESENHFYGKYRGEVTDVADTTKKGRVKVKVASVMGEKEIWAMPCVPYAGASLGLFAIPPVGTSVWVEFEAGALNQPIWSGCFWKDDEIDAADAKDTIFFLKTGGITIRVDNDSGEVTIESSAGPKITLSQQGIKLEATQIDLAANGGAASLSATGFDAMNGALTVGP
ncbi:phage baseplate assembly protein V [Sphingomonas sp. MMS12-HWE2-04]|uniref:phage baseplate assembly protein V n=1 Tax=Sphingomonas sp. MMS12-HWE2-04 TaxID=3234199 RepID=UPI003850C7EC